MLSHLLSDPQIQNIQLAPQTSTFIDMMRIVFDWELNARVLPRFRGAICEAAGREAHLFHNHDPATGKNLYRFPQIQYRLDRNRACLIGFNAGADALSQFMRSWDGTLNWEGEIIRPQLAVGRRELLQGGSREGMRTYRLKDWLALNRDNYEWWQETPSLLQRVARLEEILTAHFLMMAKGLDWDIHWDLQMGIVDIERMRTLTYRGAKRLGFDLVFHANADIPRHLALGKAISEGFGRIHRVG